MDTNFISLMVKCPYCDQSLMDYYKLIRGKPSIRLHVKSGDNEGIINLCSLYGSYDKVSEIDLIDGEIVEILCPVCYRNFKCKTTCNICKAPVFNVKLETGGKLHICSRINCKKRSIIWEDIYDDLTRYFLVHDY
ncbi:MAG: hypothetical protein JSV22_00040 [Bacteroidales bacterium]|nr:MAG: hypothetical protein JSV22_00040 [Bacteroidales bacterium]